MNDDPMTRIACTDPGLREALRQLRGHGLRDGTGPDPLHNADVPPEVLAEFLVLAAQEVSGHPAFGLALTLASLVNRRGVGTEALDLLMDGPLLTDDRKRWVRSELQSQSGGRAGSAEGRRAVPAMTAEDRAASLRVLDDLYAGRFDPGGSGDPVALLTLVAERREVTGMRAVRAAVYARVVDLVEDVSTSVAAISYVDAVVLAEYLYADELAMDLRRADPQVAADQAARYDSAVARLGALATRLGPSPR